MPGNLRRKAHKARSLCNFRQRFILRAIDSNYRYRIVLPEELISIAERCVGILAENLITATGSPLNSSYFPLQIQASGVKQTSSVIISATAVSCV